MSVASDIITQLKSICASTLGGTYQELRHVFNLINNDIRSGRLAYGVRSLAGNSAEGVNRVYTMDHGFEIILTDTIARADSDAQRQTAIATMYDKADAIFKAIVQTKVNLPTTVLNVFNPTLLEPEFFDDEKMVALRMQVTIKYRSSLT
jgi:hypothetical protein